MASRAGRHIRRTEYPELPPHDGVSPLNRPSGQMPSQLIMSGMPIRLTWCAVSPILLLLAPR
jgi:hypothetical protein